MPIDVPDDLRTIRAAAERLLRRREKLIAAPLDPRGRGRLFDIDRQVIDVIAGLRIDPCDASAEVPLILLPVRVECRIAGDELRVRITPDEIHADALSRALTDAEAEAARVYWRRVWAESSSADAWRELVSALGADRAGWAARAMTPTDLAQRGGAEPAFPDEPRERTAGTVARCLPDRFVVSVTVGGRELTPVSGSPVPRDLPLSPIAFGDDAVTAPAAGMLRVPAGSEWTVDFDAAEAVGLGVRVRLPRGTTAIDSVIVVGTRNTVDENDNAAELADLLIGHAHTDGFDLLPHGTPTNNADADRSRYRPGPTAGEPAATPAEPSAEAADVARLLGVDGKVVQSLLSSLDIRSTLDATQRAANTSLWWATWEYVLRKVDETSAAGVTPSTIEAARRLHRDDLRAAGHASALRVGAQPYGVLPVTDLASWVPRTGEITADLVPLVQRILARWSDRARSGARVRPNDEISDQTLIDLLGTSPVSTGVRARPAVDGPTAVSLSAAAGLADSVVSAESAVTKAILAQYSIELAGRLAAPRLPDHARLIPLPLVSDRDAEVIAEILADGAPKVDSVLQALLDIAWDAAKAARFRAAPKAYVAPLLSLIEPGDLIVHLAQTASASSTHERMDDTAPPEQYYAAAATLREKVHFDGQPTTPVSLSAIEPVAEARTSLAEVALDLGDTPQARWLAQDAVASMLEAFAMASEARDAMVSLGAAPIDERRVAVASAIDLAAHRVDAWATAIAASRQRTLATGEGITIGAFGCIEDIRVAGGEPQGWLHAPSPSHAVAAGMLASAHQSSIGAKPGTAPFAIDLTSARGVQLRRILEGMRRGQSIGAMLGYQIERGLTGSAARFQLTLRQIAPASTDELGNDAASDQRTARMAAADVVDGVELLRLHPVSTLDAAGSSLRAALDTPPQNVYISAADWAPSTVQEWETVKRALSTAAQTLDAVTDALLSESVLQYASGNGARARVAMDASGMSEGIDPDLGILGVRQAGRSLTHAALALIPEKAKGWSSTRPRAIAEPRLEAWAARRLGPAQKIIVGSGPAGLITMADAGFAALDLVFADDLAALARDLASVIPDMGELAIETDPGWPDGARSVADAAALAITLRRIITAGPALTPDRLVGPGEHLQHAVDADELLARCDALLAKFGRVLREAQDALAAIPAGADGSPAIDPLSFAVDDAAVPLVSAAVAPLAAFGSVLTPNPRIPTDAGWAVSAMKTATARWTSAAALLVALRSLAEALSDTELISQADEVAQTVLGDGFRLLPVLRHIADEGSDINRALRHPAFTAPPPSRLSAFIRDHATVHDGMGLLAEAQLLGRAFGHPVELTAVQFTFVDDTGTPEPGTQRWLAGDLADDAPWPAHPASHVVVETVGTPAAVIDDVAGIVFDTWVEILPFQPDAASFDEQQVTQDARAVRAARATTGLAVHANQSSARAPQVILSAVAPTRERWTTASLLGTVRQAITLAKARTVTYENVPGDAAILPAAYVASPWLQAGKGLYFGDVSHFDWSTVAYPFVSEVK
ncbi:hypothetical protein PQI51_07520 [Microbacterium esteraromaticum]|uniref:hypothetical protein n=1 Tax=Microbacterium esteraromaticum TaxID=57043 RepID=UPI003099D11A